MAKAAELVLTAPEPLEVAPRDPLMSFIERASMDPTFDVAKLQALLAMKERFDATAAKKAYVAAMAAFKAEGMKVIKDKINKQYESRYTSLENLVETVTPFLSRHQLTADWEIDQTAGIKVTLVITHALGHSERRASMIVPPDDSGKKNAIQQIKSAITYAKTCTYESGLGIASTVGSLSDDGNGACSNGDVDEACEWLANALDLDELRKLYKDAYAKFEASPGALKAIIAAKNARRKELEG